MDKIKKFVHDKRLYLLFFFLSLIIFIIVGIIYKLVPFGNESLLFSDLNAQEYPMLLSMKNSILNGEINYAWHGGFGEPFYRMFFNYMSSPLNILSLFFSNDNMVLCLHIIICLKIILAGFTFIFYIKKKFNSDDLILLIPTLLYAFSGYMIIYFFNIKWTDMIIFLPLLTYSIELLVDKHKIYPYIIILCLIMFDNFYLGYMMCIYTAIYFIVYNLFYTKGNNLLDKINKMSKNFLIILGSTITFILLTSFFILPNYYASTTFNAIGGGFPSGRLYDYTFVDFIVSHLSLINNNINYSPNGNPPVLGVGIISILCFIPYIFNKNIKLKDKAFDLSMLIIFILIMTIPMLDFIINTFHIPNGLPYRYSFMYIFIFLIIVTKQLLNSDKKFLCIIGSLFIEGVLIFALKKNDYYLMENTYILINIGLVIIFTILYLIKNKYFKYLMILFVVFEITLFSYKRLDFNMAFTKNYYILNESSLISKYNSNYYKFEINEQQQDYISNSYLYNVNSTSGYTSTLYADVCLTMGKFGVITDGGTRMIYLPNTPVYNSLFNIKYLYKYDISEEYFYNDGEVYVNKYPLSLIYSVNNYDSKFGFRDFMDSQNKMVYDFTSIDNVLESIDYTKKEIYSDDSIVIYDYYFKDDDFYFFYTNDDVYFIADSINIYSHHDIDLMYLKKYGNDRKNINPKYQTILRSNDKVLTIAFIKGNNEDGIYFFKTNKKKFEKMYDYISNHQANIDEIDTNHIKGNITIENGMKVFTSIPYDKGWTAYVDGEKVDTYMIYDAFLGFDVDDGYHEFELKYEPPYLKKGIIISSITLLSMVLYYMYRRIRHGKSR